MSEQINDYINKIINLDFIQALKMTFVHMTLCFVVLGIIVFFQWFSIFYPYIEYIFFFDDTNDVCVSIYSKKKTESCFHVVLCAFEYAFYLLWKTILYFDFDSASFICAYDIFGYNLSYLFLFRKENPFFY